MTAKFGLTILIVSAMLCKSSGARCDDSTKADSDSSDSGLKGAMFIKSGFTLGAAGFVRMALKIENGDTEWGRAPYASPYVAWFPLTAFVAPESREYCAAVHFGNEGPVAAEARARARAFSNLKHRSAREETSGPPPEGPYSMTLRNKKLLLNGSPLEGPYDVPEWAVENLTGWKSSMGAQCAFMSHGIFLAPGVPSTSKSVSVKLKEYDERISANVNSILSIGYVFSPNMYFSFLIGAELSTLEEVSRTNETGKAVPGAERHPVSLVLGVGANLETVTAVLGALKN
jgi:hypothetical protein